MLFVTRTHDPNSIDTIGISIDSWPFYFFQSFSNFIKIINSQSVVVFSRYQMSRFKFRHAAVAKRTCGTRGRGLEAVAILGRYARGRGLEVDSGCGDGVPPWVVSGWYVVVSVPMSVWAVARGAETTRGINVGSDLGDGIAVDACRNLNRELRKQIV